MPYLAMLNNLLKNSWIRMRIRSVQWFLNKVANRQTDIQTNRHTDIQTNAGRYITCLSEITTNSRRILKLEIS